MSLVPLVLRKHRTIRRSGLGAGKRPQIVDHFIVWAGTLASCDMSSVKNNSKPISP